MNARFGNPELQHGHLQARNAPPGRTGKKGKGNTFRKGTTLMTDQKSAKPVSAAATKPSFTNEQIAHQLTDNFWIREGEPTRHFDIPVGGTITVNYAGLTQKGQFYAHYALELWSDVTGIQFVTTRGQADIMFDDWDSGAYAYSNLNSDGSIDQSFVNVSTSWISGDGYNLSNYSFQTYIHEIGHALGLGHAGNYNGSADYGIDNDYANDSWQATVMSYFSQTENTAIDADFAYVATPQVADVMAIRALYGSSGDTRTSDTVYGDNGTAGSIMNHIIGNSTPTTYTIVDDGGIDTLNFADTGQDQTIDLREQAISSVRGVDGNLIIAQGTRIENAISGSGNDLIVANDLQNILTGGAGNDRFVFHDAASPSANIDTITDFEDGSDLICFVDDDLGPALSFGLLDFSAVGSDVSIQFNDDQILLENVSLASLDVSDFLFV